MRELAFCVISPPTLLERFPEVQSLDPKDKCRLIELWCDLARQVEGEAPNANIVEFLEKRFRITWSTLRKGNRRPTFLHDWRNISASGSNLSPGSGSRPVGGMDAIRGDFARAR
jgi:hypothetical protein